MNHGASTKQPAGLAYRFFGPGVSGRFPPSKTVRRFAIGILLAALLANEFLAARLLSADGLLDATTVSSIRWVQAILCITGISLLLRLRAALFALIVGLALGNLLEFRKQVTTALYGGRVTEGQLQELRKAIPMEGHVGYVSDETHPRYGYVGTKRYYLTQYAVAPIVVETGPTRDWIIGNFNRFDRSEAPDNTRVVRDFGGGIILFRRNSE